MREYAFMLVYQVEMQKEYSDEITKKEIVCVNLLDEAGLKYNSVLKEEKVPVKKLTKK